MGAIDSLQATRQRGPWAIAGDVVEFVELPVNASCNNVSIMGKLKPLQHDGCSVQEPLGVCAAGRFRKVEERENLVEELFEGVLGSRFGVDRVSSHLRAPTMGG